MMMRSTTISMVCFFVLARAGASASSQSSPSMRARTKPFFCMSSRSLVCSPLRPRTTGASSMIFVRSGRAVMASMI